MKLVLLNNITLSLYLIFQYFRKLFLDAFASNVKRKLKESYDLFRIIHVHIPEIIPPILTMHQTFLKVKIKF